MSEDKSYEMNPENFLSNFRGFIMKYSFEIKLEAVKSYLSGCSKKQITETYGINRTDFLFGLSAIDNIVKMV